MVIALEATSKSSRPREYPADYAFKINMQCVCNKYYDTKISYNHKVWSRLKNTFGVTVSTPCLLGVLETQRKHGTGIF